MTASGRARVTRRVLIEDSGAFARAEVASDVAIDALRRGRRGIDGHATNRIDWQTPCAWLCGERQGKHTCRLGDVLEAARATGSDFVFRQLVGDRCPRSRRHQDLTRLGSARNQRREIDGSAIPIAVTVDGAAGVNAHSCPKRSVALADLVDDPNRQTHDSRRLSHTDHDCVADAFYLLGTVLRQQAMNARVKLARSVCGELVAVRFGQRSEASEVGKKKRLLLVAHPS